MNLSPSQMRGMLATAVSLVALGLLSWLMRTGPSVSVPRRVPDVAAETAAGLWGRDGDSSSAEPLDLEGTFEAFDGVPSGDSGSWPRFRGHRFNNIATAGPGVLAGWPASGPVERWRIRLGEGHAGPAVFQGRVYVLDYDEQREGDALRCFSLDDGREIWRRWYHAPTKRNHGVSRTVPAVTDRFVVSIGPRGHVLCADAASGDFRWGLDLAAEYGGEIPLWYTGQCPLIDNDVAVLAPGGRALMIGVACEDGRVLWETPNPDGWKMSHSSIMPMTLLGERMFVYCALGGAVGVSAEGRDRGQVRWRFRAWNHPIQAPSPVALDERRLFLTAGYGGGSMVMGLRRGDDGGLVAEEIYTLEKTVFACEQQTPIRYREHLFGILPKDAGALRGQLACLDPEGSLVWTSGRTQRFGLGPFLVVDDKILVLNDNGELALIRASVEDFEMLGRSRVLTGRDAWAPMAWVDGKLLLRDSTDLICLDWSVSNSAVAKSASLDGGPLTANARER